MEESINNKIKNFKIEREGKYYLEKYPIFLSAVHKFYTIAFPILLITLVLIKNIHSYSSLPVGYLVFNTFISFIITSITILYLFWLHFNDFK